MKYVLFLSLLCASCLACSCTGSQNQATPTAEETTEEVEPAEEAEEVVEEWRGEPKGITDENYAYLKGIWDTQPPVVKAAGRGDQLFLLRFLEYQKQTELAQNVRDIWDKNPDQMFYDLEIGAYDPEHHRLKWNSHDEYETVHHQTKLYPQQPKNFDLIATTRLSYSGSDSQRVSRLRFSKNLEELIWVEHDEVMSNKGLIARELSNGKATIWKEMEEDVVWRIDPDHPYLWVKYQQDSVKLVYDGDGHFVLLDPSLKGLTKKDSAYLQSFRSNFTAEVQEGLSDFNRVKAYARHLNMQTELNKLENIEARLGGMENQEWTFKVDKNFFEVKAADENARYGHRAYFHKPTSGDLVVSVAVSDCDPDCRYAINFTLYKQKKKLGVRAPEEYIKDFNGLPKKVQEKFLSPFKADDFSIGLGYSSIVIEYKRNNGLKLVWDGAQFVEYK